MKLRSGVDSSVSEMSCSPPSPKRIRLDGELKLEDLPEHILDKILRFLPMKDRIHSRLVNQRWRLAMPYTDRKGCLRVTDLPFKADLKWINDLGFEVVSEGGIAAALKCLLPQPQIGSKLKSLSFASVNRLWQMVASHFDLIIQYCPVLTGLSLMDPSYAERSCFKCAALRRLTNVTNLHLESLLDDTAGENDKFHLILDISGLIAMLPLKQLILKDFDFPPSVVAPNLTILTLKSCKNLSDFQMAQICQTSPSLTQLIIDDCEGLKDFTSIGQLRNLSKLQLVKVTLGEDNMESVAQNLPDLNSLSLKEVDVGKFTWLRHLGQLKFFSISPDLDDSDVADFPDNWSVEKMRLVESQLTDVGLDQLSRKCPMLKRLTLESENFTDVGIDKIAASWDQLEYLRISNATLNGDCLARLGQRQNLHLLNVENCSGISSTDGFWLLVVDRLQLGISTPLQIKLGRNHQLLGIRMITRLMEKLKTVRVTLIQ